MANQVCQIQEKTESLRSIQKDEATKQLIADKYLLGFAHSRFGMKGFYVTPDALPFMCVPAEADSGAPIFDASGHLVGVNVRFDPELDFAGNKKSARDYEIVNFYERVDYPAVAAFIRSHLSE
ncbi:MAG: hypothetical protein J0G29_02900 [Alphaproteobacteria bacterium]|nr:hypothetical protein [Alphaproteobacteria bacterium]